MKFKKIVKKYFTFKNANILTGNENKPIMTFEKLKEKIFFLMSYRHKKK